MPGLVASPAPISPVMPSPLPRSPHRTDRLCKIYNENIAHVHSSTYESLLLLITCGTWTLVWSQHTFTARGPGPAQPHVRLCRNRRNCRIHTVTQEYTEVQWIYAPVC